MPFVNIVNIDSLTKRNKFSFISPKFCKPLDFAAPNSQDQVKTKLTIFFFAHVDIIVIVALYLKLSVANFLNFLISEHGHRMA